MFDAAPPAFTHVFIPAELFGVLQSYLGVRPAAETGRLLVALESCPTGFVNAPALAFAGGGDEEGDTPTITAADQGDTEGA